MLFQLHTLGHHHQLCADQLWCHYLGCANTTLSNRRANKFGDAKVDQLDRRVGGEFLTTDEDVLGFQVSVEHLTAMNKLQTLHCLLQDTCCHFFVQEVFTILFDTTSKLPTSYLFHDNHYVLRLRGTRPKCIIAANAFTDVGMPLDLCQHFSLFADLSNLLFGGGIHQQSPDGDGLASVLGIRIALLVAEVDSALASYPKHLVGLNHKWIFLGTKDFELFYGTQHIGDNTPSARFLACPCCLHTGTNKRHTEANHCQGSTQAALGITFEVMVSITCDPTTSESGGGSQLTRSC
mmetsp:Transcript_96821/g.186692  ORF Transcript_96821/g.186692 Transcript_96821/m.186692 type:complete len:293 (+) Transcript_96821:46-924(+)